jgi:hypothetical protein
MTTDILFEQRLGAHLDVPGRGGGVWLSDTQCRAVCEVIAAARSVLRQHEYHMGTSLTDDLVRDLRAALAALDRPSPPTVEG